MKVSFRFNCVVQLTSFLQDARVLQYQNFVGPLDFVWAVMTVMSSRRVIMCYLLLSYAHLLPQWMEGRFRFEFRAWENEVEELSWVSFSGYFKVSQILKLWTWVRTIENWNLNNKLLSIILREPILFDGSPFNPCKLAGSISTQRQRLFLFSVYLNNDPRIFSNT